MTGQKHFGWPSLILRVQEVIRVLSFAVGQPLFTTQATAHGSPMLLALNLRAGKPGCQRPRQTLPAEENPLTTRRWGPQALAVCDWRQRVERWGCQLWNTSRNPVSLWFTTMLWQRPEVRPGLSSRRHKVHCAPVAFNFRASPILSPGTGGRSSNPQSGENERAVCR